MTYTLIIINSVSSRHYSVQFTFCDF